MTREGRSFRLAHRAAVAWRVLALLGVGLACPRAVADTPGAVPAISSIDQTRIAILDESERLEEQILETRGRIRDRIRSFYRLRRAGGALGSLVGSSTTGGASALRMRYQLARRVMGADLKALRASMRRAQILDDLRERLRRDQSAGSVRPETPPPASGAAPMLPQFTVAQNTGRLFVHTPPGGLRQPGEAPVPFASLRGRLPLPVRGTTQLQIRPRDQQVEIGVGPAAVAQAVAAGRVEYVGDYAGLGKIVIIDHGNRWHTVTGGLVTTSLGRGAVVTPGQAIGVAGTSVIFEVRREGRPIDTMSWLGLR